MEKFLGTKEFELLQARNRQMEKPDKEKDGENGKEI
jgi:hypothetical protein